LPWFVLISSLEFVYVYCFTTVEGHIYPIIAVVYGLCIRLE